MHYSNFCSLKNLSPGNFSISVCSLCEQRPHLRSFRMRFFCCRHLCECRFGVCPDGAVQLDALLLEGAPVGLRRCSVLRGASRSCAPAFSSARASRLFPIVPLLFFGDDILQFVLDGSSVLRRQLYVLVELLDLPFHLSDEAVPRLVVVVPSVSAGAYEVGVDRPVIFSSCYLWASARRRKCSRRFLSGNADVCCFTRR